ncbi:MAG TPA: hypothetical protein VF943_17025 [Burkholderiales bacterium]
MNIIDRSTLPALHLAARRERAQAVHRLLIAPLLALLKDRPVRQTRMLRRSAFG